MSHSTLVSSSLPPGLRGALNRWFIEVLPGIFVGHASKRVRDELWSSIRDWHTQERPEEAPGYAAFIEAADNEQGFAIRACGDHRYVVIDHDGMLLVRQHHKEAPAADLKDLPDPTW